MSPHSIPTTADVAGALARFFHGGAGPSHSTISRVLLEAGYFDDYEPRPDVQGPNKESRVLRAFVAARAEPARARKLIEGLLSALRLAGLVGDGASGENLDRLRRALGGAGWYLSTDGHLQAFAGVDLDTGGREALDEQLDRLRRSTADPGLLIGTAKDLLEAIAKFVLEELGWSPTAKMDFGQVWHLARERLGVLPEQVDPDLPGASAIKLIHQSTWRIAEQVNALRNLQGTGHGRTLPTGISEELALLVVREAGSVAEYMLSLLERSKSSS
ncbi:MAG: abortive infection family protein [Dermatophilaceae bacterium]|nr:abortive infection family protein [Dermatophilaceae bacterium]